MDEKMSNYDDVRNAIERGAEARFPGYKGPTWGQFTPGKECIVLPQRTQVAFGSRVYWLDVPAGAIQSGDEVVVLERGTFETVTQVGMTMKGDYFETKDVIPHRFGTFVELKRKAAKNG